MNIYKKDSTDELISQMASDIVHLAKKKVADNGKFTIALSGGSSPKKLFEVLSAEPLSSEFPWQSTWFFFGDERYVPADDDANNAKMARETMLNKASVPDDHILAVNTSLSPAEAAKSYESIIRSHFDQKDPIFDLILLGLGDDAHTASLFPHTKVLAETEALVKEVKMLHDNSWRITMTRPLINHAENIFFLTFGINKAKAVHQVIEGDVYEFQYPAQFIQPVNGSVTWYLDTAASSRLTKHH
jgi:6-phosphogluconolactonase